MNKGIIFIFSLLLLLGGRVLYGQNVQRDTAMFGNSVVLNTVAEEVHLNRSGISAFPGVEYLPRFALKANLLYGATTTVNLGVEFLLNRFLTLDISGGWNPFVHRENKKFAHWMVQPTLRYWIQEPFNGHFIGGSLMYGDFNIGGIGLPLNLLPALPDRRFRGQAYSASLQYGHQWILSPRWSLETTINVGYMFLDFQEFQGGWCGERLGSDTRHYFGITNAAVSIIYIIR
jgi:hypothetical protein